MPKHNRNSEVIKVTQSLKTENVSSPSLTPDFEAIPSPSESVKSEHQADSSTTRSAKRRRTSGSGESRISLKTKILSRHTAIKSELLYNLKKYTPDPENFPLFERTYEMNQFSTEAVVQYLTEFAEKSEMTFVGEQTDPVLTNLQSWSDYMDHVHGRPASHSVAFVTKVIAETNTIPSPEKVDDVDYKAIYTTMAALMKGYPIPELDDRSKQVLAYLYDELMTDVQSDAASTDLNELHTIMINQNQGPREGADSEWEISSLERILESDSELNPLKMPLRLLIGRDELLSSRIEESKLLNE